MAADLLVQSTGTGLTEYSKDSCSSSIGILYLWMVIYPENSHLALYLKVQILMLLMAFEVSYNKDAVYVA